MRGSGQPDAAAFEAKRAAGDYAPTSLRLSRKFKQVVREQAAAHNLSMNAFVVMVVDDFMKRHGGAALVDYDPAFVAFLRRERKRG